MLSVLDGKSVWEFGSVGYTLWEITETVLTFIKVLWVSGGQPRSSALRLVALPEYSASP